MFTDIRGELKPAETRVYCPRHAGVRCNDGEDNLAAIARITGTWRRVGPMFCEQYRTI